MDRECCPGSTDRAEQRPSRKHNRGWYSVPTENQIRGEVCLHLDRRAGLSGMHTLTHIPLE